MKALLGLLVGGTLWVVLANAGLAAPFAYVSNERAGSVSVIDTATDVVVATVPVGDAPYGVAAGSYGTRVYVANRRSNDVSVIDTATNSVVATIGVGDGPFGVAAEADGARVYVANAFSNVLSVIDASTRNVVANVGVDPHPKGVAVNRAGTRVYVASDQSLAVVDTASLSVIARAPIGGTAYGVAVSPDARQVYVGARQVTIYDPQPPPPCLPPPTSGSTPLPCPVYPIEIVHHRVLVLDAATNAFIGAAELDGTPFGIAVDPRGSAVYATTPGTGMLWIIDGRSALVTRKLAVGVAPYGVSVHPQNGRVYVADAYSNSVHVVDGTTGSIVREVGAGVSPVAFGSFVGPVADLLAIEYYHRTYDHYFLTAGENEIALLDAGAFPGWARSGQSFRVRPAGTDGAPDVCRFWSGSTFAPKSSHFYTPFDWECAKVRNDPSWTFEGTQFALNLPDSRSSCVPGRVPLYRLYNDGRSGAPNHRYTTRLNIREAMVAQGWIPEGYGTLGVIGCVRVP